MIDTRLGHWIIDTELGRGGMGRVFLAHRAPDAPPSDDMHAEQAAVKVLAAELAQESGFQERFLREIDALQKLNHPNIVRFYESGVEDGKYFYAMEYVPGRNFEQILEEQGRLPWQEVLDMALQICPALKHAHDHGIIHRDIKPQNLLRTETAVVKLTDFGVAKVFAGRHLTATGGLVGTAEYVSPEQAAGKPVSPRSDLYSFGILLYTLLTGRVPFEGETVLDLMHKHRYGQFERPQRLVPELPHDIDDVVCSLLEKDPVARPANAQILQRQLDSIRRKYERKSKLTVAEVHSARTVADDDDKQHDRGPGPATLASQLVRAELVRQNQAGPIGRFFQSAWVLVVSLILCAGALVWGFWPPSAESLFEQGAALMARPDVRDWEKAWDQYFTPLMQKYPNHPYGAELMEYRKRLEDRKVETRSQRQTANTIPTSEAQRFYLQGQRYRKEGDPVAAQQTWQNLVDVFQHVPGEERWVRLARTGLAELNPLVPSQDERRHTVRNVLDKTRKLPPEEAEKVYRAIESLYRNDPSAEEILRDVARYRAAVR